MTRSTSTRHDTPATPKPKTLAQQNSDFTAEGSPPPGQVAGATTKPGGRTGVAPMKRARAAKPI